MCDMSITFPFVFPLSNINFYIYKAHFNPIYRIAHAGPYVTSYKYLYVRTKQPLLPVTKPGPDIEICYRWATQGQFSAQNY